MVRHILLSAILLITPAFAQISGGQASGVDLSGAWVPSRDQDPGLGTAAGALVDYGGIPINQAGRLYGLAWDASRMTVRQ